MKKAETINKICNSAVSPRNKLSYIKTINYKLTFFN